eukprot:scaffold73782_cov67-Attheya_sp.AAC.1
MGRVRSCYGVCQRQLLLTIETHRNGPSGHYFKDPGNFPLYSHHLSAHPHPNVCVWTLKKALCGPT